jgi:hypothetical protein
MYRMALYTALSAHPKIVEQWIHIKICGVRPLTSSMLAAILDKLKMGFNLLLLRKHTEGFSLG